MGPNLIRTAQTSLVLGLTIWLAACSEPVTPENQIRQFIATAAEAAERRSLDDLADLLHPQYKDQKGLRPKQVRALLQGYFLRHKNIHLLTRINRIDIAANSASVELHVAMAASVIADVDALAALRAKIYRFELHLVKDSEWRLRYANWQPANLADLQ